MQNYKGDSTQPEDALGHERGHHVATACIYFAGTFVILLMFMGTVGIFFINGFDVQQISVPPGGYTDFQSTTTSMLTDEVEIFGDMCILGPFSSRPDPPMQAPANATDVCRDSLLLAVNNTWSMALQPKDQIKLKLNASNPTNVTIILGQDRYEKWQINHADESLILAKLDSRRMQTWNDTIASTTAVFVVLTDGSGNSSVAIQVTFWRQYECTTPGVPWRQKIHIPAGFSTGWWTAVAPMHPSTSPYSMAYCPASPLIITAQNHRRYLFIVCMFIIAVFATGIGISMLWYKYFDVQQKRMGGQFEQIPLSEQREDHL